MKQHKSFPLTIVEIKSPKMDWQFLPEAVGETLFPCRFIFSRLPPLLGS